MDLSRRDQADVASLPSGSADETTETGRGSQAPGAGRHRAQFSNGDAAAPTSPVERGPYQSSRDPARSERARGRRRTLHDSGAPEQHLATGSGFEREDRYSDEPASDSAHEYPPGEPRRRSSGRPRRMTTRPSIRASSFAPGRLPRGRSVQIGLPGALQHSRLLADHVSVALIGVAAFSLLLLWITVANRLSSLSDPTVLRYDAEGLPALTAPPRTLLQLPLLATFATAMNLVVAWSVASTDRFSGRFMLATAILVQLLTWIAVVALVW